MVRYRRSTSIGNMTVYYTVAAHKGYKKPVMRYEKEGLVVIVPETYGSAQTKKFIDEHAEWIMERENAGRNEKIRADGEEISKRTAAEFETLTKTVFTRLFHNYAAGMLPPAAMPEIRFRYMKTVIASKNERKNTLTFSRSLTYSDKDAVSFAAAYGFALLCAPYGSPAFTDTLDAVCPDWKKTRSKLPESLKNSLRRL